MFNWIRRLFMKWNNRKWELKAKTVDHNLAGVYTDDDLIADTDSKSFRADMKDLGEK